MEPRNWTLEPALKPGEDAFLAEQGVDQNIYAEVIGKAPDNLVSIYEGAEEDGDASERDGRKRFRNVTMICVRVKGEKDYISERLTDEHKRRYPRAFARYVAQQNAPARLSVKLLPGISAADLMELEALQLIWVDALATAEVPANLTVWRDLARRLQTLSKPRLRMVDGKLEEVAA